MISIQNILPEKNKNVYTLNHPFVDFHRTKSIVRYKFHVTILKLHLNSYFTIIHLNDHF